MDYFHIKVGAGHAPLTSAERHLYFDVVEKLDGSLCPHVKIHYVKEIMEAALQNFSGQNKQLRDSRKLRVIPADGRWQNYAVEIYKKAGVICHAEAEPFKHDWTKKGCPEEETNI